MNTNNPDFVENAGNIEKNIIERIKFIYKYINNYLRAIITITTLSFIFYIITSDIDGPGFIILLALLWLFIFGYLYTNLLMYITLNTYKKHLTISSQHIEL